MRVTGVSPLICVADLERSVAFYRLLGFEPVLQWDTYAKLVTGDGGAVLHLGTAGDAPPDRPTVALAEPAGSAGSATVSAIVVVEVDDCGEAARALAATGARLLGGPGEPPWGGEVRAFVQDPDGHLVELNQPLG